MSLSLGWLDVGVAGSVVFVVWAMSDAADGRLLIVRVAASLFPALPPSVELREERVAHRRGVPTNSASWGSPDVCDT